MQRILKERDRLLRRTVRYSGLASCFLAAVCIVLPGGVAPLTLVSTLALVAITAIAHYFIGERGAPLWMAICLIAGNFAILLLGVDPGAVRDAGEALDPALSHDPSVAAVAAIAVIGSGVLGALALMATMSRSRLLLIAVGFALTCLSVTVASAPRALPSSTPLLLTIAAWAAIGTAGWWIAQSVPRVMQRIASIGRAHRAERLASEAEAQRRQDARLLHDTVLATLTLLAHSGVGVSADALRHQAANDAKLLRQLRLGGVPTPLRSGTYNLQPVAESALGNTLESVKQRFGRMGLDVKWHGSGQILLPSAVLDAFLGALGECLENVRRHAQVSEADVTITDDEHTLRAMVTDAGVGFNLGDVDPARLGFAESVVGRLREVGGNARLFSSPGSGTTVVLEVPKHDEVFGHDEAAGYDEPYGHERHFGGER
ncbi:sensor histidine kinase [Microterricola viridarii]|uniref:Signal transduction histidine kinase n=1 Tax=Microterricola viridarii TaxID=412690 RepID=A0A1H1R804_9MICO|nr:ATP-binding protein [Microterricola viridarii]SDS31917.1 Signal transduction histidine kinase [Microterricola viridarii]